MKKRSRIFKILRWIRNLIPCTKKKSKSKKSTHCNKDIKENSGHNRLEEISKYSSSDSLNQTNRSFTRNIVATTTVGIIEDSNELSINQAENNSSSDDKLPAKKSISRNDARSETTKEFGDFQCCVDILKTFANMKSDPRILRDIYESIKSVLISLAQKEKLDAENIIDLLENLKTNPKIKSKLQNTVRDIFVAHFIKEQQTSDTERRLINIHKPLTDIEIQSKNCVMPIQLDDEKIKIKQETNFDHHELRDEGGLFEPSKFVREISCITDSKSDENLVSVEYVSRNNDEQNLDLYRNENFSNENDKSEEINSKKLCRSYGLIDLTSLFYLETDDDDDKSNSKEYVRLVETMEKNVSFDIDTCEKNECTIERGVTAFVFYHHSGKVSPDVKSMNAKINAPLHSNFDITENAKSEVSSILSSCEESLKDEIIATKMLNGTMILPTENDNNGSGDSRAIRTKITSQSAISNNDLCLTGIHPNVLSPTNSKMSNFD